MGIGRALRRGRGQVVIVHAERVIADDVTKDVEVEPLVDGFKAGAESLLANFHGNRWCKGKG